MLDSCKHNQHAVAEVVLYACCGLNGGRSAAWCAAAEEEFEQIERGQLKGQAKGRATEDGEEPGKLD